MVLEEAFFFESLFLGRGAEQRGAPAPAAIARRRLVPLHVAGDQLELRFGVAPAAAVEDRYPRGQVGGLLVPADDHVVVRPPGQAVGLVRHLHVVRPRLPRGHLPLQRRLDDQVLVGGREADRIDVVAALDDHRLLRVAGLERVNGDGRTVIALVVVSQQLPPHRGGRRAAGQRLGLERDLLAQVLHDQLVGPGQVVFEVLLEDGGGVRRGERPEGDGGRVDAGRHVGEFELVDALGQFHLARLADDAVAGGEELGAGVVERIDQLLLRTERGRVGGGVDGQGEVPPRRRLQRRPGGGARGRAAVR